MAAMGPQSGRAALRNRGRLTGRPVKISREVARKELKVVTEVVSMQGVDGVRHEKLEAEKVSMQEDVGMGAAVGGGDARSVVEQEW